LLIEKGFVINFEKWFDKNIEPIIFRSFSKIYIFATHFPLQDDDKEETNLKPGHATLKPFPSLPSATLSPQVSMFSKLFFLCHCHSISYNV
jgi:hypothetical protein